MYIQRIATLGAMSTAAMIFLSASQANAASIRLNGATTLRNVEVVRTVTGNIPYFTNSGSVRLLSATLTLPDDAPVRAGMSSGSVLGLGRTAPIYNVAMSGSGAGGSAPGTSGASAGGGSFVPEFSLSPALAVADLSLSADSTFLLSDLSPRWDADEKSTTFPSPIDEGGDFGSAQGAASLSSPPSVPTPSAALGGLLLLAGALLGRRA